MTVLRRLRALVFGAVVVGATLIAPAAAHAAPPASALWWFDGNGSFSGNGYVDSDGATFNSFAPQAGDPPLTQIDVSKPGFYEGFGAMGADETALSPGTYTDALNPRTAGHPYFFTYDAFACNGVASGSFTVHEVEFDGAGKTTKFAADLAWQCSASPRVHYRTVRYNSTWPTAAIALSVQTLDFGTTVAGQTTERSILVASIGTTPVHVTGTSIAGGQAADFGVTTDGCTGVTLAPTDGCEILVHAVPHGGGVASTQLVLTTDGYAAQEDVPLSQTAIEPTATVVHLGADVIAENSSVLATAYVTPLGAHGHVEFLLDGDPIGLDVDVDPDTGTAQRQIPASSVATHHVTARFAGPGYVDSTSRSVDFVTKRRTTVTVGPSVNPVAVTEPVTLTAHVAGIPDYIPPTTGTLTIVDETTATTLATIPVTSQIQTATVTTSFAALGTHSIVAHYDGGTGEWMDGSATLDEVVGTDTSVNASGVTVNGSSIYPYHDGYRDTLVVTGVRNETVSVAIKVTSSSHKTVASANVPAGTGAYGWTWTGKWSTGALLPAGSYVIQQTLTDTNGNTLVVSRTVSLSAKRLYWHTGTTTIYGGSFQLAGTQPGGSHETITKQNTPYSHEVRIHVGNPGWVAVEYQVVEPAAASYGTITVYVKGKISGKAWIGVWNQALGAYKYIDSYDAGKVVGPGTTTWSTHATEPTHISSRHVHVMVYIGTPFGSATVDVATVKVTYRYAILK